MANHSIKPDVHPLSKTWDEVMAGSNASGEAEQSTYYPGVDVPPAQDGSSTPASNDTGVGVEPVEPEPNPEP